MPFRQIRNAPTACRSKVSLVLGRMFLAGVVNFPSMIVFPAPDKLLMVKDFLIIIVAVSSPLAIERFPSSTQLPGSSQITSPSYVAEVHN